MVHRELRVERLVPETAAKAARKTMSATPHPHRRAEQRLSDAARRLARRAGSEPILEPDLPIVDPHHHLWDRPGWRYLLDELLADTNSGHNIVATVFVQCPRHAPRRRARGDAAGRRDRVRQRRRRHERQRHLRHRPRSAPASSATPT